MRTPRRWVLVALLLPILLGVSVWFAWQPAEQANPILDGMPATGDRASGGTGRMPQEQTPGGGTEAGRPARTAVADASWLVGGEIRRGSKTPFEGARIEIDVFAGYETKGTPLARHRVESRAEGRFELRRAPPGQTVTLRFRSGTPDLYVRRRTALVVRGATPPQNVVLYAYPLDRVLAGIVVNEQREPLPGATVLTRARSEGTTTGADGRFRARVSSASSRIDVQAAAPGYALLRRSVQPPQPGDESEIELVLKRGFAVRGTVRDEAGSPIEGARVTTFFTSFYQPALSDARGQFEISWLEPGRERHSLFARKAGFIEARTTVEKSKPKESYNLVMKRGARVEGRVFDSHRKPLAGAELYIGFSPSAYNRIDAVSRDDGSFVFAHVTPGERRLSVEARGHAPHVIEVDVQGDVPVTQIDLFLLTGGSVGGRVQDAAGKPLAGVWVSTLQAGTRHARGEYIGTHVESDEEGRFRVEHLPQGTIHLEFYASGFVRRTLQAVELGRDDLDVTLERSAGLTGKVVDASTGEPVRKFRIRLSDATGGGYSARWVRQGFEFDEPTGVWRSRSENFKPGLSFTVEARAEGYAPARQRNVTAKVDPDPEACVLRLARGGTIRGSVLSPRGTLLADARIVISTPDSPYKGRRYEDFHGRISTQTDDKGEFELRDVPPGQVTLFAEHAQWPVTQDGPFQVASRQLVQRVIRLAVSGEIAGVLFGLDRRPVPRARVELTPTDSARLIARHTTTDETGRFRFADGLGAGRYWVRPGGEPPDALRNVIVGAMLTLTPGQQLEVELRPHGACELLVEVRGAAGASGKPILQLHKMLDEQRPDPEFSAPSLHLDSQGKARVRGVAAGRYMVSGWLFQEGTPRFGKTVVTVAAGSPAKAVIQLRQGR